MSSCDFGSHVHGLDLSFFTSVACFAESRSSQVGLSVRPRRATASRDRAGGGGAFQGAARKPPPALHQPSKVKQTHNLADTGNTHHKGDDFI